MQEVDTFKQAVIKGSVGWLGQLARRSVDRSMDCMTENRAFMLLHGGSRFIKTYLSHNQS